MCTCEGNIQGGGGKVGSFSRFWGAIAPSITPPPKKKGFAPPSLISDYKGGYKGEGGGGKGAIAPPLTPEILRQKMFSIW